MWHHRTDTEILTLVGEALRGERIQQRMRQEDLAETAGVSLATVQRLEAGNPVRTDTLIRCCRILRMLDRLEGVFTQNQPPSPFDVIERQQAESSPSRVRHSRGPGPR